MGIFALSVNDDIISDTKSEDYSNIDCIIGKRLKYRRKELNMSQKALASALGITFQQVQKYEKGINRIGVARLFKICEILDVLPSYFLDNYKKIVKTNELLSFADNNKYDQSDRLLLLIEFYKSIKSARKKELLIQFASMLADEDP